MRKLCGLNVLGNQNSTDVLGNLKSACSATTSVNAPGSPKSPNVTAQHSIPLQMIQVFSELENDDKEDKT